MRDGATIIRPNPSQHVFVEGRRRGGAEAVYSRQYSLEAAGVGVIGEQGISDAMIVRIASVEVAAIRESKGFKVGQAGVFREFRHCCYNTSNFLQGIVAAKA